MNGICCTASVFTLLTTRTAGISGDDWWHPATKASLQHILVEWARNHSLALGVASGRTWFMGASEHAWGSCDKNKQIRWVVRGPA